MGTIAIILLVWFWHAAAGALPCILIDQVAGRRVHWRPWEFLAFVLPFSVWCVLAATRIKTKEMDNVAELFILSLTIPVAAIVRVVAGSRVDETVLAVRLLTFLCVVAAVVYFVTPNLGATFSH